LIELLLQAEGALSVGLLDRAETLYRQVANADPRNAIAIVGLSRVALERGQQAASLELARRALDIDHENVAAQRMVQRLEEVLAFQGVDVTRTAVVPLAGQVGRPAPEGATEQAAPGQVGRPAPSGATEQPVPGQVGRPAPEGDTEQPVPGQVGRPAPEGATDRRSLVDRFFRRR
jgi:hypothetical protein